ncbi:MAG: M60 family metallopeptidase [Clostridium sp.]|nr:M60 family metallopeptidase [Clostridium sp.]
MKQKISTTLAVALIASQMQNVAYAETITNKEAIDILNGEILQSDKNNKDSNLEDKAESNNDIISTEDNADKVNDIENSENIEQASEDENVQETENIEVTEEVKEVDEKVETETEETKETVENIDYEVTGKLELDINFSTPIKNETTENTNISVRLIGESGEVGIIKLGSDNKNGSIGDTGITYNLEALNSKRSSLEDGDNSVYFYHLTFNKLPLGNYSLQILGNGYKTANIGNIDIQDSSKRVLVGTSESDDNQVLDEVYPVAFLSGDVNSDNKVDKSDYDAIKDKIKSKEYDSSFDLNRDGKVDVTDLSYVHKNMDKASADATILDTDPILNPNNIDINVNNTTKVEGNIRDILADNGSGVKLSPKNNAEISENNAIEIPINLSGKTRSTTNVEKITIEAPKDTAPGKGLISIPGQEDIKFDETNSRTIEARNADGKEVSVIEIDLEGQVAVSEITIKVTGGRGNKNLAEITKVNFLNNVYKEMPKPNMNIPVINNFTSSTAVGNEAMTLGWNHENNISGYEIKVEELKEDGSVKSTSTYKTTENTLKIEKVNGYSTYRVSIQSLNGDWKSGYKDEQDDYNEDKVGSTNLENNSNDKDGIPDNVDENYIPKGWDSTSGKLSSNGEGGNKFGADSIIELQVIPETAPEGPEGIKIEGAYKGILNVSWKSHKKAKDYDLYYRKLGTGQWFKAKDPNEPKYVDSDPTNDIPDGVANLSPAEKTDNDELIRATSYTITGLEDNATYEIKMTATNHHGTGGLSQTYLGATKGINPPKMSEYKLINRVVEGEEHTSNIVDVEYGRVDPGSHPDGMEGNKFAIVDNDFSTYWTSFTWNSSHNSGPTVTFDKEYTIDTIRIATRLDGVYAYDVTYDYVPVRYFDSEKNEFVNVNAKYTTLKDKDNGTLYYEVKLPNPVTTSKIQTALRINPSYGKAQYSSISEIKFYEYDSLENDVAALFKGDLMLELNDDVTQERIDELIKRANTIDSASMEYHPKQEQLLADLKRAQDLFNDIKLSDNIKTLDVGIRNNTSNDGGHTIGQSNDYQALGVAVKPGDTVNIYIGSSRKDTKFKLAITQHNGESGTYIKEYNQLLTVGKNEITIPDSPFDMDYEKGGNLYLRFNSGFNDGQEVQVRVSGGTEIPHLNVNNMMDDSSKESEVKDSIRQYIRELKSYVSTVQDRYPKTVTPADRAKNIYAYDPETSILNSTEIESDRVSLSLAADQVLKGIESGLAGNEDAQVNRVYDTLMAWEQLMKVSYAQQGLLEKPIDFDNDGKIGNNPLEELNGKSEQQFFKDNKAPLNRINVKYQRMFTGAFMYASGHHVGIGYGSIQGMMQGVPFKFDENGNLLNSDEGQLFGWGINHEIGHVHDRPGLTYAEVTNNILALISETFNDINTSRIEGTSYKGVYNKVTSGSVGLASSGIEKLAMFWQLHLAYDNDYTYDMLDLNTDNDLENDTFYAKLYRATRVNGVAPKEVGHDQTAQTFIMRSSDAIEKDLREYFEKWGIVASPETNKYLDSKGYDKEDKAIYYLNDEARRKRLKAIDNNDMSSITMNAETKVNGTFGADKNGNAITEKSYLNQKEVPLRLSVDRDSDKILGYEIIRREATATGIKETPVGFVERDKESDITEYTDILDTLNNRAFEYKVKAYDYSLNVTKETTIGNVKVNHDGSISNRDWVFETNTRSEDDVVNENTGHGQSQDGSINNIKDSDVSTVYNASKATDKDGQIISGDPYVTVDMGETKSIVGLKYTPGKTETKKFSIMNFFKKNSEITYNPISKYKVLVSEDGENWVKAHSGTFDTTKENTIYFNEAGNSDNTQLWAYNAKYVKLVAEGSETISIAELDILGPTGDNIEIGIDNGDKVYKNGIGRLKSDYKYADGKVIEAGSIIVTGEYKGDPAFNIPLVFNEDDENFAREAQSILLAKLPEDSELGEVAEGKWIYWITPEQQKMIVEGEPNVKGTSIKAELYRYNKLEGNTPIGQRLVSDTFYYDIPALNNLPQIDLNAGSARTINDSYDEVVEINSSVMSEAMENR